MFQFVFPISFLSTFTILVAVAGALSIPDKTKINCFEEHLTSLKKLSTFQRKSEGNPSVNCKQVIKDFQAEVYKDFIELANSKNDSEININCIINALKLQNYVETIMLQQIYELSDNLTAEGKRKKLTRLDDEIKHFMTNSFNACHFNFGEMFDLYVAEDIMSAENYTDEELNGDYCLKKHLVENNLIDTKSYTIVLKPTNANVTDVICDKALGEVIDYLKIIMFSILEKEEAKEEEKTCAMQRITEHKAAEKVAALLILKKLSLSASQLYHERKGFEDSMLESYVSFYECFKV